MKEKAIINAVLLEGDEFKKTVHSYCAAAVLNGKAKTASSLLRSIYKELRANDNIDTDIRSNITVLDYPHFPSYLDFIAYCDVSNDPAKVDFFYMKSEFVRLLMERAGV